MGYYTARRYGVYPKRKLCVQVRTLRKFGNCKTCRQASVDMRILCLYTQSSSYRHSPSYVNIKIYQKHLIAVTYVGVG